jgi:hypothetical protein
MWTVGGSDGDRAMTLNKIGYATNYILHYGWVCCIIIAMFGKIVITSPWWIYYMLVIIRNGESNVLDKTVDYILRSC